MEKNKRDVIKLVRVLVLTNWGGFAAKGANFSGNLSSSILCQTDVILHLSLRGTQRQFSGKYLFGRRFEI